MKRLTKEIVNERLIERKISLVGEYYGVQKKSLFQCGDNSHRWEALVDNVLRGTGCPHCHGNSKYTVDEVNSILESKGIRLAGEYINTKAKTKFVCLKNHEWYAAPGHVMNDTGCPHCGNRAPLTKETVNERCEGRDITMISDCTGARKKAQFKCNKNHVWTTTPASILNQMSGCPSCAEYGFNPDKESVAYLLKFDTFLKFGITNNINRRLKTLKKNGKYEVITTKKFVTGHQALLWEKSVKILFSGKNLSKDICPDGYTETLPLDSLSDAINTLIQ